MANVVVIDGPNRGAVLRLLPAANRIGRDATCDLPILDDGISRVHAEIGVAADGPARLRDLGSKNGTYLNGVRLDESQELALAHGDEVRLGQALLLFVEDGDGRGGVHDVAAATDTSEGPPTAAGGAGTTAGALVAGSIAAGHVRPRTLVGESEAIRRLGSRIQRLAPLDSTVLIVGESGVGKELVAEALHRLGPRRRGSFVPVNCATLERALLESELFGHERGAFTGAVARRLGKFELARGGTLFLDEVGELPLDVQAKLLRAVEGREFQRVGGNEVLRSDARLVAATHRDLGTLTAEKRFREDLGFRLRVVEVAVPPLRERPEDLAPLVAHFVADLRTRIPTAAREFSEAALERLRRYPFPGNVRELRNIIERCLIFADGPAIGVAEVSVAIAGGVRGTAPPEPPGAGAAWGEGLTLQEIERRHVERTLASSGWNKTRASEILGIDRATLYAKVKRHGIEPPP